MPILKFWNKSGKISLTDSGIDKIGEFVNITHNPNAKLMPKDSFLSSSYRIANTNVFITKSDLILNLAIKNHPHPHIAALYCEYKNCHIIIVPKKSYCFYEGNSVEPTEFSVFNYPSQSEIQKQIKNYN